MAAQAPPVDLTAQGLEWRGQDLPKSQLEQLLSELFYLVALSLDDDEANDAIRDRARQTLNTKLQNHELAGDTEFNENITWKKMCLCSPSEISC